MNAIQFQLKYLIQTLFVLLFLISCNKKEVTDQVLDLGYQYFPLDSGASKIFLVDSISYNDNTETIDTFQFLMKEQIGGIISGQNLLNHTEIFHWVQTDSNKIWLPRNSAFALITAQNLQMLDENIRIVKLVFPIGNVTTWNGNQYNNKGKRNFILQKNAIPFNNGDSVFQNCLVVQEAKENNIIEEILVQSVYCKGLGLIDFTNNYINTQGTKQSGYKVHQKLISYTVK